MKTKQAVFSISAGVEVRPGCESMLLKRFNLFTRVTKRSETEVEADEHRINGGPLVHIGKPVFSGVNPL